MSGKEEAKQEFHEIETTVKPQAEAEDDEKTLELLDDVFEAFENDNPVKAAKKGQELQERVEEKNYTV